MRIKKFILNISLLILLPLQMLAGGSNQTVVEGRYWNYIDVYTHLVGNKWVTELTERNGYHFEGEIVLDQTTYSIFKDGEGNDMAYMREEDGRVYLRTGETAPRFMFIEPAYDLPYEIETEPEVMVYDFNLKAGNSGALTGFDDTSATGGVIQWITVTDTFTQQYSSTSYFCQVLNESDYLRDTDIKNYIMIEGIGGLKGLLCTPVYGNPCVGTPTYYHRINNVTDADGNIIYESPIASVHQINSQNMMNQSLYNLQGMPIDRAEPGIIVIRNGRKYIVPDSGF